MKKHIILTAVTFALATFTGFADDSAPSAADSWAKHCKKCHGETGAADTALGKKLEIKDYTKAEALADISDEQLHKDIKDGVEGTKMPGYADKLSDAEIDALVAYIRAMAK